MRLIRNNSNPVLEKGCVATIGNFDGLHLGHQAIFNQLKKRAQELGLPSAVITFEPLPKEHFSKKNPELALSRLTRFKEKWQYLEKIGIDWMVCLHFHAQLAEWTASHFVHHLLLEKLNVKLLIVGEDFHFGHSREGDLAFLEVCAQKNGFILEMADTQLLEGTRISSTRVREALKRNDLGLAEKLLGRLYTVSGKVIHGDKQARQWGFPTANLTVHRSILPTLLPVKGVYAVLVDIPGSTNLPGVANVGYRPTVNGFRHLLEVHLLNFNDTLYDKNINVKFVHKIREEQRFDSLALLKEKILEDVEIAKHYFRC